LRLVASRRSEGEIADLTQFGGGSGGAGGEGGSAPVAVSFRPEDIAALIEALKGAQIALGSGVAQAHGEGASATVNYEPHYGSQPEEVEGMLRAAGEAAQAKIDELAGELNTTREAVVGFLRTMRREEVRPEQLPATLALIAQRYNAMMERLAALEPEDDEAQALIEEARETLRGASRSTDYDRADELLSRAEEAQERSLRRVEELEREAHEAARRMRASRAATRAERAELELTRLNYLKAEQHFREAARVIAGDDQFQELAYLFRAAVALHTYGDERGDNTSLKGAIDSYREIARREESDSYNWATAQNNLGIVLRVLGERESGTGRLKEAVAAFRAALEVRTRERVPLKWAATQNNLGNALASLGERESGTARLEEAAAAYREVLKERTRERVPLDWAMTQNNLGTALTSLGEREGGTARLEEAVAAHREALKERTRERVPLEWAESQTNLGLALRNLGEREGDTERLQEAVSSYGAALEEWTRDRVPLRWAAAQNNLGTALASLGERERGTERLKGATAAYREALKERTRERVPLEWAMTQNNLGTALTSLGKREEDVSKLHEARRAIEEAWGVYREAGMNQYDGYFSRRLKEMDELIAALGEPKE
jgi:tetratricopeptide (TPR) repeat protein